MQRNAFTLVELLIVVVMLSILAMLTISQISNTSAEARESSLLKDLRMVREQIELFRLQHEGILPGQGDDDIVAQMTGKTDVSGAVTADGNYGPYMSIFPTNPFTESDTVKTASGGSPGSGPQAWWYDKDTGKFCANDHAHKDR